MNTGTIDKTFQQYGKKDPFRYILIQNSTSMYKNLGSFFLRTIRNAIRNVMNKGILLYSFKSLLEGKAGKEIPEPSRLEF